MEKTNLKNEYTLTKLSADIKKMRLSRSFKIDDLAKATYTPLVNITKIEKSDFGFVDKVYMRGIIENIFRSLGTKGEEYWQENKDKIDQLLEELKQQKKNIQSKGEDKDTISSKPYLANYNEKEVLLPKKNILIVGIFIGLSIIVILGVVITAFNYFNKRQKNQFYDNLKEISEKKQDEKRQYKLYSHEDSFILNENDSIKIFLQNKIYELIIEEINQNSAKFVINNNKYILTKEQKDLKIILDEQNNSEIKIQLKKQDDEEIILFVRMENQEIDKKKYEKLWIAENKIKVKNEHVLFKATNQRPIVVYIKAKGIPSNIVYNVDGNQTDNFNLIPNNDILIQAEEHLQLQLGNYRSLMLFINDIPIELDLNINSFSISKIIKWVPNGDNENLFDLIIKDMIRP